MPDTKTPDPKTVRSGWCSLTSHPDLGDWSHRRCPGSTAGAACPCECHHRVVDMRGFDPSDWIDVWGHYWRWQPPVWVHDRGRCEAQPCGVAS